MPVKYFAPKVTVKLCIIDFPPRDNRCSKMNNLNVCSAHTIYIHGPGLMRLQISPLKSSSPAIKHMLK